MGGIAHMWTEPPGSSAQEKGKGMGTSAHIIVELWHFQPYSAFWNCQDLAQAEHALSCADWDKCSCMERPD